MYKHVHKYIHIFKAMLLGMYTFSWFLSLFHLLFLLLKYNVLSFLSCKNSCSHFLAISSILLFPIFIVKLIFVNFIGLEITHGIGGTHGYTWVSHKDVALRSLSGPLPIPFWSSSPAQHSGHQELNSLVCHTPSSWCFCLETFLLWTESPETWAN